jgi:sulfur carrier protein
MDISLNGEACCVGGETLTQLLLEHAIDPGKPGVAIAVNARIVPRSAWASAVLKPGDSVEIVSPHSGG